MKTKNKHILLSVLACLVVFSTASAQRTQSGQPSLRVSALYNGLSAGAEAFYEQYTLAGYWTVGLEGNLYRAGLSTGDVLDYCHALAECGYMFRLAGTRSRSLSLYAGGGALAGVELLDPLGSLPGYVRLSMPACSFLYGLYAQAVVEWFVTTRLALLLQVSVPVSLGSSVRAVNASVGLGLKLNL